MRALAVLTAFAALASGRNPVFPEGTKPGGPFSPGIMTADHLYVAGQGARDSAGKLPEGVQAQTRQCLINVKRIVEAAGLTMEHVVYTQVYLSDIKTYDGMNQAYAEFFPKNPPARAVLAVTRMPTDTPVEINAIAVRNLPSKIPVLLRGSNADGPAHFAMLGASRLFLSGVLGKNADSNRLPSKPADQVELAFSRAARVLKAAKMDLSNLVFANIYITSAIPPEAAEAVAARRLPAKAARAILQVSALPAGANVEITGFAHPRGAATDTEFVSLKTGPTEAMLSDFKRDLEARGLKMENVVAVNVYIDDVDNFAAMNKMYTTFFPEPRPARTTVQPTPPAPGKPNRISAIVVR